MQNKATDLFSDWAKIGKDQGMANAHEPAVTEILRATIDDRNKPFSFIDAGCGNGWVVRKVRSNSFCESACGVDGAKVMIDNARETDPEGEYYLEDLMSWAPDKKADIIHSMEVFYYFKEPNLLIKHIVDNWLNPGGTLVIGLDHYIGNPDSYHWSKDLNVHMSLLKEQDWLDMFTDAGLSGCKSWRANASKDFPGTLVVAGDLLA